MKHQLLTAFVVISSMLFVQQARAELIAAAQHYENARQSWQYLQQSGSPDLRQRIQLLDQLWRASEINTTEYLVQLQQTLATEVRAIKQRGRMWQAWNHWLKASAQADQWLQLRGNLL